MIRILLILPLLVSALTTEEILILQNVPIKEYKELEGFNIFAKSILREHRNEERDKLFSEMHQQEVVLDPEFYSQYQSYAEQFRRSRSYADELARKNVTLPIRLRFLLMMDCRLTPDVKEFMNNDHVFDRLQTIIRSTLPPDWISKSLPEFSDEYRNHIRQQFVKAFAHKLREMKRHPEIRHPTLDYVIPEDIRETLLKDPGFPIEAYEKLNYDHKFNKTMEETLKKVRASGVELVDVANQPEEMLRRRALPRWRIERPPVAVVQSTDENSVDSDEIIAELSEQNETLSLRERLGKLREEQNNALLNKSGAEAIRNRRHAENFSDPRDELVSSSYQKSLDAYYTEEDGLVDTIIQELNLDRANVIDIGSSPADSTEPSFNVRGLYNLSQPVECITDNKLIHEEEYLRQEALTDYYDKLETQISLARQREGQQKRLQYLNDVVVKIREKKNAGTPIDEILASGEVNVIYKSDYTTIAPVSESTTDQPVAIITTQNPSEACSPKLDIVFVLDTSSSLERTYREHVNWAVALVESLPIDPDTVRVAAVQYANFPLTEFALGTYPTAKNVSDHLRQINATEGEEARTGHALRKAELELFRADRGARYSQLLVSKWFLRENASKVIVLFTDGKSLDDPTKEAKKLRDNKNVHIFVASAKEPASAKLMEEIAGDQQLVFGPSQLKSLREALIVEAERTRACLRIGGPRSGYKPKSLPELGPKQRIDVKPPTIKRTSAENVVSADFNSDPAQDQHVKDVLDNLNKAAAPFESSVGLIPLSHASEDQTPRQRICDSDDPSCEDAFETRPEFYTTKPLAVVTPAPRHTPTRHRFPGRAQEVPLPERDQIQAVSLSNSVVIQPVENAEPTTPEGEAGEIRAVSLSPRQARVRELIATHTERPVHRPIPTRLPALSPPTTTRATFTVSMRQLPVSTSTVRSEFTHSSERLTTLDPARATAPEANQPWRTVQTTTPRQPTPTNSARTASLVDSPSSKTTSAQTFTTRRLRFHAPTSTSLPRTDAVRCPHDILFVVDSSGSVQKNYELQRKYILDIVSNITIGPDAHRVALIQFAGARIQKTEFSYDTMADNPQMMSTLKQVRHLTGTTFIGAALSSARHMLETRRRDVPSVVVLISDGYSQDDATAPAERIRSMADVFFYAASVSDSNNRTYLERLVGVKENVFTDGTSGELSELIKKRLACRVI